MTDQRCECGGLDPCPVHDLTPAPDPRDARIAALEAELAMRDRIIEIYEAQATRLDADLQALTVERDARLTPAQAATVCAFLKEECERQHARADKAEAERDERDM